MMQKTMKKALKEDIRNETKKVVKKGTLKPRSKDYCIINHHRYHEHCVLEPQNLMQKLYMIRMNGLEVITTIVIGIAAIWFASWGSSIMYFLSGMLFVASKSFVPDRLYKR